MGRLTAQLIDNWRRRALSRRPRFIQLQHVATRVEVPNPLPRRRIVVVGTPAKWAVMPCPCGRGHVLNVNLGHARLPRWRIDGEYRPSVHPSIDIKNPAGRCHFCIRRGRVTWMRGHR
jgi:hypothetical protein